MSEELVPYEAFEHKIYYIRGQKVMLDFDLARLYGIETRALNQAIKRNGERFSEDFMFQLTKEEAVNIKCNFSASALRSQIVTLKRGEHYKYFPYAFTEQGISMLSSVLRSKRAIQMNIAIMRAFVRLRQILAAHKELAHKLEQLERKVGALDSDVKAIFDVIKQLMSPLPEKPKKVGFLKE